MIEVELRYLIRADTEVGRELGAGEMRDGK